MIKIDTIECIKTRTSIRDYKQTQIPDSVIKELLEAAIQAPSAGNK